MTTRCVWRSWRWSAEREVNYRPYVIAGGGISYDVMRDKDKVILPKPFDCFVEVGFGCDFYFRWCKCCPEIRYRIGFLDVLTPVADREKEKWNIGESDYFYTITETAVGRRSSPNSSSLWKPAAARNTTCAAPSPTL